MRTFTTSNNTDMTTQDIKVGLKWERTSTGILYEVTRTSDVSVWFKALDRATVWRRSKIQFLAEITNPVNKVKII